MACHGLRNLVVFVRSLYCISDEENVVKTEKDIVRITESLDQETSDQTNQVVAIIKPDDDYQSGPVNSDTTRTSLFDGDSDGDSSLDNVSSQSDTVQISVKQSFL